MKLKYYLRGIGVGIVVTSLILYLATSGKTSMTDEEIKARAKELGMIENMTLQNAISSNKSSDKVTSSANSVYATSDADKNSASDNVVDNVVDNKNSSVYGLKDKTEADTKSNIENNVDNDKNQDLVAQKTNDESKLTEEKADDKENKVEDKTENKPEDKIEDKIDNKLEDKIENKLEDKADNKIDVISNNSVSNENDTSTSTNIETISITIIAGDSSYSAAKKLQKEGIVQSAALFDEYLCKNGYDKRLVVGTHKIPKNASDEEIAKIITGKK